MGIILPQTYPNLLWENIENSIFNCQIRTSVLYYTVVKTELKTKKNVVAYYVCYVPLNSKKKVKKWQEQNTSS